MNSSTKFLPKQKLPCQAHFREYKSPFRSGPTHTEDFRNHSTFAEVQRSDRWTRLDGSQRWLAKETLLYSDNRRSR